jgi:2-iminobutanoate/2-iminopropanoate deaminase
MCQSKGGSLKDVIATSRSPKAIGPYSQAIKAGGFLFVSGQLPLDPVSGEAVPGDTAAQAARVLENLNAILESAGSSLAKVVKATIFLKDLSEFGAVNEVYAKYFPAAPPARSTIEVARLPKGVSIEIDLIALA